ncbi:hypothetical protein K432DRAFT_253623, partial [Lepidopterella palustris CBS 459.81]
SFSERNIHGSGHFGVGVVLRTIGNAHNSPATQQICLHGNMDRSLWEWQSQSVSIRLNQVGGSMLPFDYRGQNVTLDFEDKVGKLGWSAALKELLD